MILAVMSSVPARACEAARAVSFDLRAVPLAASLTRVEQASGLHLAFSQDLVKDAEPVTLTAENESVADVLRAILRPCGLECIYTGETMAAIVSADSDMGMAKAAGRAIRVLARPARKLDSAQQKGDEVVMPDWTGADDRALAEAYAELNCVKDYFIRRGRQKMAISKDDILSAQLALERFDPEVRIGISATGLYFSASDERTAEALTKMARDADALVRGAAVIIRAGWSPYELWVSPDLPKAAAEADPDALLPGQPGLTYYGYGIAKEDEMRTWAADADPEVRFAAATCFSRHYYYKFADEILGVLRADRCAAVRAAAWPSPWLSSPLRPDINPKLRSEQLLGLGRGLRDPNPIVRAVVIQRMATLLQDDNDKVLAVYKLDQAAVHFPALLKADREKLWAVLKAEGVENDPWVALAAEAFLARSMVVWHTRLQWKSRASEGKFAVPAELVQERNKAATLIAGLLASGKRSHEMLACAALLDWLPVLAIARPPADSAFAPVAAQAESPHLLTRLVAIAACGALAPEDAEPPLLKALASRDRLERLAGLWGCCTIEPGSGSPALEKALRPLLRGGPVHDNTLAARAVARVLPIQRAIAVLQDQCLSLPESPATAAMIDWMARTRPSKVYDQGDGPQNQLMLFDAVLESKNASLQCRFLRCAEGRKSFRDNDPLILACMTETEPEAFYGYSGYARPPKWFAVDAFLQRLAGLVRTQDGKPSIPALTALAWYVSNNAGVISARRDRIYAMITPFLETCFRPGASDEEVDMGGTMVNNLIGNVRAVPGRMWVESPLKWSDLPPAVIAACRAYLGYANHSVHHRSVAFALAACYERITQDPDRPDPELLKAMEAARAAIVQKGVPDDQAIVLAAVAASEDDALAEPAIVELQKRFVAGTMPADKVYNFCHTLNGWVFRTKKPLSPEFTRFLIARINAPVEGAMRLSLSMVIDAVAAQPGTLEPLIAALQQLAEKEPEQLGQAPRAIDLFRQELQKARKEGKPDPPWLPAATELALKMAAHLQADPAEDAMAFYREAVGPKAAETIEAMVQDETLPANVRAAAAGELFRAKPDTKLLPALAQNYDRLPVDVRELLARAVTFAKKQPEGAAAFLKRYYRDKQVDASQRAWAISSDHAPPTPELRPVFEELANDPDLGKAAKDAIKRLDALAQQQRDQQERSGK